MKYLLLLSLLLITFYCRVADAQRISPIVNTKSGPIKGQLLGPFNNETNDFQVYQFTGIPFAEPPVGELRFRKTTPVKAWTASSTVLDATNLPQPCIQSSRGVFKVDDFQPSSIIGSENCLLLNIWAPKKALDAAVSNQPGRQLLPTYIFIHGGGFISGSATLYNATILSGFTNIIVVSIQYRLGSLGFGYYDNTDGMPGNMGLWDQLEAIKWVHENIAAFGGDNNAITIGGQDAGAASVTFHLLSPYSRKYFQRAMIASGSGLSPWASHTAEQAVNVTDTMLCALLKNQTCTGITSTSSAADKVRCLKTFPDKMFPAGDLTVASAGFGVPFSPVVDNAFLPRDPGEMFKDGNFYKCPLLLGAVKNEGSSLLSMAPIAMEMLSVPFYPKLAKAISIDDLNITHFRKLINESFHVFMSGLQKISTMMLDLTEAMYWPRKHEGYPNGTEIVIAASDVIGDNSLICPTYAVATAAIKTLYKKIYAYRYSHRRFGEKLPEWMGVVHSSEMPLLFGYPFLPQNSSASVYTDDDQAISYVLMTFWSNFIKFGDPNGAGGAVSKLDKKRPPLQKWPLYNEGEHLNCVMDIHVDKQVYGNDTPTVCGLKGGDCMFWQDVYPDLIKTGKDKKKSSACRIHAKILTLIMLDFSISFFIFNLP